MHRLGQPTEPSVILDEERAIDLRTSAEGLRDEACHRRGEVVVGSIIDARGWVLAREDPSDIDCFGGVDAFVRRAKWIDRLTNVVMDLHVAGVSRARDAMVGCGVIQSGDDKLTQLKGNHLSRRFHRL